MSASEPQGGREKSECPISPEREFGFDSSRPVPLSSSPFFFQSCISVYVLPFWHVSLLPSRSPFCSSSQNETRNLGRKKKKEQNVCRAIVWSRIGRELDGTALMASKRPKPKPPLEARRRHHHQQHHRRTQELKKGTRGGIQPVDRRLPLAFAKQSSLLPPPVFSSLSAKKAAAFFSLWEMGERKRGGSYLSQEEEEQRC